MESLFNHFLLQFLRLQSESDVSDILKLCIGFDIEENIFIFFCFFFFLRLQSESDVSDILKLCIGFDIEENIFFFFYFIFFTKL